MTGAAAQDWMTPVLASSSQEIPGWQLLAGWTDDGHLMTTLRLDHCGEPYIAGGFGGPPVWDNQVINHWYGAGDSEACLYVVVRTLPRIQRAWVTVNQDTWPVPLSESHPDFGVRFGACQLPTGDRPVRDLRPTFGAA